MDNLLIRLIKEFPNDNWNWKTIFSNPNITWEFIEEYFPNGIFKLSSFLETGSQEIRVNWNCVSKNINITWEIVYNNPNILWNWYELSRHPNITLQIILDNPINKLHERFGKLASWFWDAISMNPNITAEIIKNAINEKGEFIIGHPQSSKDLNPNPLIRKCFIYSKNQKYFIPLRWYDLSKNPNLTWEIVYKYLDKSWNWVALSKHPNITWENIESTLNDKRIHTDFYTGLIYPTMNIIKWIMKYISKNPNITPEIVYANPNSVLKTKFGYEVSWNYNSLLNNDNFKLEDIDKIIAMTSNEEVVVKKKKLIYNKNITFKEYHSRNYHWDTMALVSSSSTSLEDIMENIHIFVADYVFLNPNITYEYIIANKHMAPHMMLNLSHNYLEQHPEFVMKRKRIAWKNIIELIVLFG